MAISAQPEEHIIMETKFVYSVPWEGEDLRKSSVKEENGHHPLPVLVSISVKDDNWTEMILQPMPNFLERLSLYICKTVILPLLKGLRDKVLHILQAIGVPRFFFKKGWARWIQLWHLPWKTRIITFYSAPCLFWCFKMSCFCENWFWVSAVVAGAVDKQESGASPPPEADAETRANQTHHDEVMSRWTLLFYSKGTLESNYRHFMITSIFFFYLRQFLILENACMGYRCQCGQLVKAHCCLFLNYTNKPALYL